MKHHQSIYFSVLVFFTVALNISAQTGNNSHKYFISTTIFDEHIAAPFSARSDSPRHLGGTISFESLRKRNGAYQFTNILQAGYYYHKDFNQVAFVAWKPKFELQFYNLVNIHTILGIGYAHSFPTQPTYRLEDGKYKSKNNWGKSHLIPSVGFGAGLHFDKLLDIPVEIFTRYEIFGLGPYAIKGRIPLTINTMTSIGLKFSLN